MRCPTLADLPPPPPGKTGWPWTVGSPQLPDTMAEGQPWPRISIVTPSYNQGQFIEETIRSVLLQGYPDLEYIIIDGASADNSVEIIQKYKPWLSYWVSEKDRGQAHAINKGLAKSSGQILNWLNSDDTFLERSLRCVAEINAVTPAASIISGVRLLQDLNGAVFRAQVRWLEAWPLYKLGVPDFPQDATFFLRDTWNQVEPLDERMHFHFDVAFFAKVLSTAKMISLTDAPLSKMLVYPEMKTLRYDERKADEYNLLLKDYFSNTILTKLLLRLLRTRFHRILFSFLKIFSRRSELFSVVNYDVRSKSWEISAIY